MPRSMRAKYRPNSDELSRWFYRARRQDAGALQQLLALYRPLLLQKAQQSLKGALRTKVAPSDIVQMTIWKATQDFTCSDFRDRKAFLAWLLTILNNAAADERRRFQEAQKRDISRERSLHSVEAQQWLIQLSARITDVLDNGQHSVATIEDVLEAVERLPPHYQLAIRLRYFDRLTFEAVGRKLERSADAARVLHNRAIKRLQQELL